RVLIADAQQLRLHADVEGAAFLDLGHVGIGRKFRRLLRRRAGGEHQRCDDARCNKPDHLAPSAHAGAYNANDGAFPDPANASPCMNSDTTPPVFTSTLGSSTGTSPRFTKVGSAAMILPT